MASEKVCWDVSGSHPWRRDDTFGLCTFLCCLRTFPKEHTNFPWSCSWSVADIQLLKHKLYKCCQAIWMDSSSMHPEHWAYMSMTHSTERCMESLQTTSIRLTPSHCAQLRAQSCARLHWTGVYPNLELSHSFLHHWGLIKSVTWHLLPSLWIQVSKAHRNTNVWILRFLIFSRTA